MADPLSITASVLAIATAAINTTQTLYNTIDGIKNAPDSISTIKSQLQATNTVLERLKELPRSEDSPNDSAVQLKLVVQNYDRACTSFQKQIDKWIKDAEGDKLFWLTRLKIGVLKEKRIKTFQDQVKNCESTVTVMLTTELYFEVTRGHDATKEACDTMLKNRGNEIEQLLDRANNEAAGLEKDMQLIKVETDDDSNEDREQARLLLLEFEQQRAANTHFMRVCENIMDTISKFTGQKIRGVKATNQSNALAGFYNAPESAFRINQDISDVSADNGSFAGAGVFGDMNLQNFGAQR